MQCVLEDAFREHSAKLPGVEMTEKHLIQRDIAEMCGQCSV